MEGIMRNLVPDWEMIHCFEVSWPGGQSMYTHSGGSKSSFRGWVRLSYIDPVEEEIGTSKSAQSCFFSDGRCDTPFDTVLKVSTSSVDAEAIIRGLPQKP
jgi:hypothetical protein